MESAINVKRDGGENDLIKRIISEPLFAPIHAKIHEILDPKRFTGRAEKQVEEFVLGEIEPLLKFNSELLDLKGNVNV
jgi:adenylosuccinate lyase